VQHKLIELLIVTPIIYLLINTVMSTRGSKVERRSVSEQPHELKYEARKEHTTVKAVEEAKQSTGSNQRGVIEKKLGRKK